MNISMKHIDDIFMEIFVKKIEFEELHGVSPTIVISPHTITITETGTNVTHIYGMDIVQSDNVTEIKVN